MIGFGTWGLGGMDYGPIKEKKALNLLNYAYKKRINFFDTAPLYGNGRSETIIGSFLRNKKRKKIIISSKGGMLPHRGFDWQQNFSFSNLLKDLNESLNRLNTDYLDYFLLHSPNIQKIRIKDMEEISSYLKSIGLIKKFGISLRSPYDFNKSKIFDLVDILEFNFNLLDQRVLDNNIFKKIKQKKITTICRTPLCFGFLSDNIIKKKELYKHDHRKYYPNSQFRAWTKLKDKFSSFKIKYKFESFSDFALSFCLSHNFDYVIPGMMNIREIDQNIDIQNKKISKNDLNEIYKNYKDIENISFITNKKKILKNIKKK